VDAFLAICQGLGLAIAAGLIIGAVVPAIMPAWGVVAGAGPLGILGCAAALGGEDEALWPALPVGILGGGLAATVSRDVAAGAGRRQRDSLGGEGQASGGVIAIVVLAAVVVAGVSLVVPPFSLVVLLGLAWLSLSRRRQQERKHEGLRVLR
jgi:hypothetical protein